MDKKVTLILGSLFILTSGIIFTLERLRAVLYWTAEIEAGPYELNPKLFPFFDNLFTVVFLLVGIALLLVSSRDTNEPKEKDFNS